MDAAASTEAAYLRAEEPMPPPPSKPVLLWSVRPPTRSEDIDECKERTFCQCKGCSCQNTWGSYECSCGGNNMIYMREHDTCIYKNPSMITSLFALSFEWSKSGSDNRIHSLFERALANDKLQKPVLLWRCYLAYEAEISCNASAARRVFFRAIHACPWSKRLWLDGFQKLSSILTLKELSDLQEVMCDKELHIRTDIYEILLQDETDM